MKERSPITSHVLDTHRGKPASSVPVHLEKKDGKQWKSLALAETNSDGRVEGLLPSGTRIENGTYRLTFNTHAYFEAHKMKGFYPEVSVVFEVASPEEHYHVPLLLSAHGYSTYRGS